MRKTRIKKLVAMVLSSIIIVSGASLVVGASRKQVNAAILSYGAKVGYTGWRYTGGGWYYYENGKMITGWKKVNGKWYYMDTYGRMQTGWLYDDGEWYYLKSSGAMATGWEKIKGYWYYFSSSGAMLEDEWLYYNGHDYFLLRGGRMATGRLIFDHDWNAVYDGNTTGLRIWHVCYFNEDEGYLEADPAEVDLSLRQR